MKKTNVARILDRMKINYIIIEYEVDEQDLSAQNVAPKVHMPLEQVFKTLVASGDKTGILLACIPGGGELDLKQLAHVSGNKKVDMVHLKEVLPLTGYIRGGVSPIGTKKKYPVYLDSSASQWDKICISAGLRGYQVVLSPADLIQVVDAQLCLVVRN